MWVAATQSGDVESMMTEDNLDDFLNGSNEAEAVEAVETPEPAAESPPRDEHGRFAPKGEQPPAVEPSASPAPERAAEPPLEHPALLGERRRRQEAEARLTALEARIAQPQAPQPPAQQAQAPDPWEDPHGYAEWVASQAVERAVGQVQGIGQQFAGATRFDVSEMIARSKFDDYDDKLSVFTDLVQANPALAARLNQEADPAGFAYRYAKNHQEVQQLGSLDLSAIEASIRAKVEAEYAARAPSPAPTIPTTLADSQSARTSAGAPQSPPSLADILSRK